MTVMHVQGSIHNLNYCTAVPILLLEFLQTISFFHLKLDFSQDYKQVYSEDFHQLLKIRPLNKKDYSVFKVF